MGDKTSFEELFGRVYEGGEDLHYLERSVSLRASDGQQTTEALRVAALVTEPNEVTIRVFNPESLDRDPQTVRVLGALELGKDWVFPLAPSDDTPDVRQFVVAEGTDRSFSFQEPMSLKLVSFDVSIEPVDENVPVS